jgi:hypothetical protein
MPSALPIFNMPVPPLWRRKMRFSRCRMLAEVKRNQSIFTRHPPRETPLSFVAMLFFGTMIWLRRMSSGPKDGGVDVPAH